MVLNNKYNNVIDFKTKYMLCKINKEINVMKISNEFHNYVIIKN